MRRFLLGFLCLSILAAATAWLWGQYTRSPTSPPSPPAGSPWFVDVTEEVGLSFTHDAGPVGDYFMPQQVGSGAALFFDGDETLCIYLLQNGGPAGAKNQLFRQMPDGRFQNVSEGSGLDIAGYNMGVAVGDVNNDGWPDVLVTRYDGVKLFLNNGDGTFSDVTREARLDVPGWCTSASFVDYDRDGFLDLVVVCYVDYDPTWPCKGGDGSRDYCAPKTFRGRVSRLFHNLGRRMVGDSLRESRPPAEQAAHPPRVRFEDATESSGLGRLPGPGLGVIGADFNGDGWPDLFIANDGAPNRLWINQKNGTFKEEAVQRGVAYNGMGQSQAGMGVAWGDVDGDGLSDLFITHLTEESNTLWKQGPRGLFRDDTAAAGLITASWRGTGFGAVLADFDHDGALDLALVNGRVLARTAPEDWSLGPFWSKYGDRNQIFAGDGHGRFRDVSPQNVPFSGRYNVARGLAVGDVDGDGALDLLVTQIGGPARLFRNVAPKRGHWLMVRAVDPALHRDAYGAEITIQVGDRRWVRLITADGGYLCSNDPRTHFGLGSIDRLEVVHVLWPDGVKEDFPCGAVDRVLPVRKGEGRPPEQ